MPRKPVPAPALVQSPMALTGITFKIAAIVTETVTKVIQAQSEAMAMSARISLGFQAFDLITAGGLFCCFPFWGVAFISFGMMLPHLQYNVDNNLPTRGRIAWVDRLN